MAADLVRLAVSSRVPVGTVDAVRVRAGLAVAIGVAVTTWAVAVRCGSARVLVAVLAAGPARVTVWEGAAGGGGPPAGTEAVRVADCGVGGTGGTAASTVAVAVIVPTDIGGGDCNVAVLVAAPGGGAAGSSVRVAVAAGGGGAMATWVSVLVFTAFAAAAAVIVAVANWRVCVGVRAAVCAWTTVAVLVGALGTGSARVGVLVGTVAALSTVVVRVRVRTLSAPSVSVDVSIAESAWAVTVADAVTVRSPPAAAIAALALGVIVAVCAAASSAVAVGRHDAEGVARSVAVATPAWWAASEALLVGVAVACVKSTQSKKRIQTVATTAVPWALGGRVWGDISRLVQGKEPPDACSPGTLGSTPTVLGASKSSIVHTKRGNPVPTNGHPHLTRVWN